MKPSKKKEVETPSFEPKILSFRIGDVLVRPEHAERMHVKGFEASCATYGNDKCFFDDINHCLVLEMEDDSGTKFSRRAWILSTWEIEKKGEGREVPLFPQGTTIFFEMIRGTKIHPIVKEKMRAKVKEPEVVFIPDEKKKAVKTPEKKPEEETGQLSLF